MKMKNYIYIPVLISIMLGCISNSEIIDSKDSHNIEKALNKSHELCDKNSMIWLSDMLHKAEEDRTNMTHQGNYIGIISLINYKNKPVVYTNFALGSGGVSFYLFDCNGNPVDCEPGNETIKIVNLARENIIYTSLSSN